MEALRDSMAEDISRVEDALLALARRFSQPPETLRHPQQETMLEWAGADVVLTSDSSRGPSGWGRELVVPTRHARALTWLFFELRDLFLPWLDFRNKHGFFGALGRAAAEHLAQHQPEPSDPRPLLEDVLQEGFAWQRILAEHGALPEDPPVVAGEDGP